MRALKLTGVDGPALLNMAERPLVEPALEAGEQVGKVVLSA